jgi:hypothetical protein
MQLLSDPGKVDRIRAKSSTFPWPVSSPANLKFSPLAGVFTGHLKFLCRVAGEYTARAKNMKDKAVRKTQTTAL